MELKYLTNQFDYMDEEIDLPAKPADDHPQTRPPSPNYGFDPGDGEFMGAS